MPPCRGEKLNLELPEGRDPKSSRGVAVSVICFILIPSFSSYDYAKIHLSANRWLSGIAQVLAEI
jgi:hypothetical protein